jgi:hypothetical protein
VIVDRAVARANTRDRRFTTRLQLSTSTGLRGNAVLVGRRSADGSSTARLRWRGPAALLLPDTTLRIVDDQLTIRTDRDAAFRSLGSASGVSLDVGRELLAHPFLLDARDAQGRRDDLVLTLVAPRDQLRRYATSERRGPVTELLRDVDALQVTPRIVDDELVHDRFVLRTRIPSTITEILPLRGATVTITGATSTCTAPSASSN